MPTPRSESIIKGRNGSADIRIAVSETEPVHRGDHFAVLSQITNAGVDAFFEDIPSLVAAQDADSLNDLEHVLKVNIHANILNTIEEDRFSVHHESLNWSQLIRSGDSRWSDIDSNILAGVGTYVAVSSEVLHILKSRLGLEAATHQQNWQIIDRIAKLNMHAFAAYQETYLRKKRFLNWDKFIDQLEVGSAGQIQFKSGYPAQAIVTEKVAQKKAEFQQSDYLLDGSIPLATLEDIEGYNDAIGCPITFRPDLVKKLWGLYASEAQRIFTKTPTNFGGSAASLR